MVEQKKKGTWPYTTYSGEDDKYGLFGTDSHPEAIYSVSADFKVTKYNSHPHQSSSCKIALVHNWIFENYEELLNKFLNIFENERGFDDLPTVYDGREIIVNLEILPSTDLGREKIKISTYDNTNNEYLGAKRIAPI